jgi:hypothetical protein
MCCPFPLYAVNEDGVDSGDEFIIRRRACSQSPERVEGTNECCTRRELKSRIAPSSPWKSSWDVWVRDMYLYDFKLNPPSTESQRRQFNQWIESGTHKDYKRWIEEPLGTIEPPTDIFEWIYHSPTKYV